MLFRSARNAHGDKYDYSLSEYKGGHKHITILCKEHGQFNQQALVHTKGHGCPKCRTSKGELKVEQWLENNQIKYESQKRFKDCRDKQPLPFDFYIEESNTCVEYDGRQHQEPVWGEETLLNTQRRDGIKNKYCIENGIRLIRITHKMM